MQLVDARPLTSYPAGMLSLTFVLAVWMLTYALISCPASRSHGLHK
jgi:hypothetical protein